MATGPPEKAQIAIIPETNCQLCDNNEIQWKCFTCEEYMCHQCKVAHLRSKASRNHKVTSTKGSDQQQQKFGRTEQQDLTCAVHAGEDLQMYCQQCKVPLCRDCIVKEKSHRSHEILKIEDAIGIKQEELSQILEESNQRISKYEDIIKLIKEYGLKYTKDIGKYIAEQKSRKEQIKAKLDQITDEQILQLQSIEKDGMERMGKKVEELETEVSNLKELTRECKTGQTQRDIQIFQFVEKVRRNLDLYKPQYPAETLSFPQLAQSMDVEEKHLKKLLGELVFEDVDLSQFDPSRKESLTQSQASFEVKCFSAFNLGEKNLVAALDDNKAWMVWWQHDNLSLVASDGAIVKNVNTGFAVNDLAVNKPGELLTTIFESNNVMKLKDNDEFVKIYEAETKFQTGGITVSDENNIIVCLHTGSFSESKFAVLNSDGKLLRAVKNPCENLYSSLVCLASNRNGDLLFTNTNQEIIAVDKTGNIRFNYKGKVEGLKYTLYTYDIATNKCGHIFINDIENSAIHILDADGKFMKLLKTDKYGLNRPWGISINKSNKIWVCSNWSKKVLILKFDSP